MHYLEQSVGAAFPELCVGGICKSHHHVILRITRSPFKEVGTEFLGFPINFSHLILEIWSSQSSGDH